MIRHTSGRCRTEPDLLGLSCTKHPYLPARAFRGLVASDSIPPGAHRKRGAVRGAPLIEVPRFMTGPEPLSGHYLNLPYRRCVRQLRNASAPSSHKRSSQPMQARTQSSVFFPSTPLQAWRRYAVSSSSSLRRRRHRPGQHCQPAHQNQRCPPRSIMPITEPWSSRDTRTALSSTTNTKISSCGIDGTDGVERLQTPIRRAPT